MSYRKLKVILTLTFVYSIGLYSQIKGWVKDTKGNPVVHAEITNDFDQSVIFTDETGAFEIDKPLKTSLKIYKDGFFPKTYFLDSKADIVIYLSALKRDKNVVLREAVFVFKDPISDKFSVTKMNKMNVYFNPAAAADPLKAVSTSPYSTASDETAKVQLRGASAERSSVLIDGIPILNPVRNSQSQDVANFSLFSPEIMEKQYVYPSNPPLIYGHSTGGIVAIETANNLEQNELIISLGLGNSGFLLAKRLNNNDDESFLQAYGNVRFSKPFIEINRPGTDDILGFSSEDLGLSLRKKLSEHAFFKSYNYSIEEDYKSIHSYLNYTGAQLANQTRFFSANSFNYRKRKTKVKLSFLIDHSKREYAYGVLDAADKHTLYFGSGSLKYQFSRSLSAQAGSDYSSTYYNYNNITPLYDYSRKKGASSRSEKFERKHRFSESYLYLNCDASRDLGFSSGLRYGNTSSREKGYLSWQASSFFKSGKGKFVMGIGKYHSYSSPNYLNQYGINLLSSTQMALDYSYIAKNFQLSLALYHKIDGGYRAISKIEDVDKIKSQGVEIGLKYNFNRYVSLNLSNTYLDQKETIDNKNYNTERNLKYFIKTQLIFSNPKLFTASLYFNTRPGNHYTAVIDSGFDSDVSNYKPVFSKDLNGERLNNYSSLDFTINKTFWIGGKYGLIAYLSCFNILNRKNERSIFYNADYTQSHFDFFRRRMTYFGLQFRVHHILKKSE